MLSTDTGKDDGLVVVAMSGGVDSSTVAAMLSKNGFRVIGITLRLYSSSSATKGNTCCAGKDIYDAKRVAYHLGIPHYVLDYESKFKKSVVDDFVSSYLSGQTPVPCIKCNQSVKFGDLLQFAKDLGGTSLVTGHYVQKLVVDGEAQMHKAIDFDKDQSYFLFTTTNDQLSYLEFPLGKLKKEETRTIAREYGLDIADKRDSQDICFVTSGNYRDMIKAAGGEASARRGNIMHINGYKLGTHDGVENYTVGQRRGLGLTSLEPLYVIRISAEENIVYVGPESALYRKEFVLNDVNLLVNRKHLEDNVFKVKVRARSSEIGCSIRLVEERSAVVTLHADEKSITPGQACVIYDETRMIGGGWIS